MKTLLLATMLSLLASEASAISKYQSTRMACGEVQAAIREEGAVILRWKSRRVSNLPLFGRFVRSSSFCEWGEVATFASVPTADDAACDVRKCVQKDPMPFRRRIWPPD